MTTTTNAYRTPPQQERKAQQELRDAGIRAHVPLEKRTCWSNNRKRTVKMPIAPGYVFAGSKTAWAKHVRSFVGVVDRKDLARLTKAARPKPEPPTQRLFKVGDKFRVGVGPFAMFCGVVTEDRGRVYMADINIFGRLVPTAVHESNMHKYIDPGG